MCCTNCVTQIPHNDAINKIFSPEFRNRIDSIIYFNHLNKEIVLSIVDKFIIQVEAQLEDKGVSLSIDKKAKEYLANIGYDEVYGARELGRVIQEKVKKPMAEELIFGALSKGGHVDITIDKEEISLKYSSSQDKKKEYSDLYLQKKMIQLNLLSFGLQVNH